MLVNAGGIRSGCTLLPKISSLPHTHYDLPSSLPNTKELQKACVILQAHSTFFHLLACISEYKLILRDENTIRILTLSS